MSKGDPLPLDPNDMLTPYVTKIKGHDRMYWLDTTDAMIELCSQDRSLYQDDVPFSGSEGGWFDTKDMPQALKYFKYGWPELADSIMIEDAALAIPREIIEQFKTYCDHAGGAVNIGAFIAGQPEDMMQFEPSTQKKKTVKLLVNVSASGGTGVNKLKQRGMTIICIIDWLEKSGYRVRLDVCDTIAGHGGAAGMFDERCNWLLAFCAKDFSQALDVSRLGFMAASASMLRRIFFGCEGVSTDFRKHFYSYGSVCPVPKEFAKEYDYVFDYMTPVSIETAAQCIEYILSGENPLNRPETLGELEDAFKGYTPDEDDFEALKAWQIHVEQGFTQAAAAAPGGQGVIETTAEELSHEVQTASPVSPDDELRWVWDHTHSYVYPLRNKK